MDVFALTATLSLQADNFFSGLADAAEAMARFAADSVQVGAGFDASMSKVSAISGATADEFDTLRELARKAGASTQFTAQEAADALTYMAMAGWKTEQMTSGLSGILDLAAASGEDLARTSDIVTDALTAFGMKAEESGHFADILAATSSNSNTNVSMMGETFKYAASIAGALGYSAEDTALAIGLMANSGIKASQAGTSLRRIMTALQGDITLTGDKLGAYTVETVNADGTMRDFRDIVTDLRSGFSRLTESEQASTAEAIAGKYAMSGFLAIMNSSEEDWNKLAAAIDNCNGAAQSMEETMMNNLSGSMKEWNSAVQDFQIALSDKLTPTIREFVDFGTKGMRDFTEAFEKDGLDGAIEVFGKFIDDGSAMILKKLPEWETKGAKVMDALSAGIEKASPVLGKVIETFGPMIGEFLEQNSETITNTVATFIESITPGIVAAIGGIFDGIAASWPTISGKIGDMMQKYGVFDFLGDIPFVGEWLKGKATGLFKPTTAAPETPKLDTTTTSFQEYTEAAGEAHNVLERWVDDLTTSDNLLEQGFGSVLSFFTGTKSKVERVAKAQTEYLDAERKLLLPETWFDPEQEGYNGNFEFKAEFIDGVSEPVKNVVETLGELYNWTAYDYNTRSNHEDNTSAQATLATSALIDLISIIDENGDFLVTESDHTDNTSEAAWAAYWALSQLFTFDEYGNFTYSEHDGSKSIPVLEQVIALLADIHAEDGYSSHTSSVHDVITRYITETDGNSTANTYAENQSKTNAEKKIEKLGGRGNYAIHARSMYEGTILRGATMFGWDAQGRPQIGGGEGPEAVVGVNSLNQQIREAVRDGLSGIVGSIAQAIGGRNEQPVYVVLDTGELVGSIGGKMDAELGKIGAWKSGGAA